MSNYQPPAPPPPPGGGGGYGAPPPAGPPGGGYGGGYGGPPAGGGFGGGGIQPYSAGDAFSYGWSKFQANMGQMILAALAIFAGALVIFGIYFVLVFTVFASDGLDCVDRDINGFCTEYDAGGLGFFGSLLLTALFTGVFFVFAQVVGAGLIREALGVTEGRPFTTAGVFKFQNIGPVMVTALLVGAGILVGTILCYIPGLIFGFFSSYSLYFLIDKGLAPVDAIKASFNFVNKNLGSTIIWYLISLVIFFVGNLACGVGLLVAIPVVLVGTAYTYKKLNGAPVAP